MPLSEDNIHTLQLMFVFTLRTKCNCWSKALDPFMLLDVSMTLMPLEKWDSKVISRRKNKMMKTKKKRRKLLLKRLVPFPPNLNKL